MNPLTLSLKVIALGTALCVSLTANAGITRTYHFPPNQAVTIQNPLYWDLDAHCQIKSNDAADDLVGMMVHRNGRINGIAVKQGEDITVTVHPSEDFHLQVDYKAVIRIVNLGQSTVSAKCTI